MSKIYIIVSVGYQGEWPIAAYSTREAAESGLDSFKATCPTEYPAHPVMYVLTEIPFIDTKETDES